MGKRIIDFPPYSSPISQDSLAIWDSTNSLTKNISLSVLEQFFAQQGVTESATGGQGSWILITSNYQANSGDKLIVNSSLTVTMPSSPVVGNTVEFLTGGSISSSSVLLLNTSNASFDGKSGYSKITLTKPYVYSGLVYVSQTDGWIEIPSQGEWLKAGQVSSGYSLYLEGSTLDLSTNNNNATPIGTRSPTIVTGLDNNPVLRWDGAGNQELQVNPFLSNTTAATIYCVFTVNSSANNYNLIRTANLDDYWRFTQDGNGYLGVFKNSRFTGYPSNMPSSGNNLLSIHCNASGYEAILNNVSSGYQAGNYYSAGDRFRIGTNDKPFIGDIASVLVYPNWIDKASTDHAANLGYFKNRYPSLPYTL